MNKEQSSQQAARIAAENKPTLDAFRIACSSLFEITAESKEQPFKRKPPIGLRFGVGDNALALAAPRFDYRTKTVLFDSQTVELLIEEQTEQEGKLFYKPVKRLTLSLSASSSRISRFYPKRLEQDAAQLLAGIRLFLDSPNQAIENSLRCAVCGRVLADGLSRARGVGPECIQVVSKWPVYTSCSVFHPVVPVQRELPLEL